MIPQALSEGARRCLTVVAVNLNPAGMHAAGGRGGGKSQPLLRSVTALDGITPALSALGMFCLSECLLVSVM